MRMLRLVRARLIGVIMARAMMALLVRNDYSADGRAFSAFLPVPTAMRPPAPADVTRARRAYSWGASSSRPTLPSGLELASSSDSFLRLRQVGRPYGKTFRRASDESGNLPTGDTARTEELSRAGSQDARREEDKGAKETLEMESGELERLRLDGLKIRATTEKLRLLVGSGKVVGGNTTLKKTIERENIEAEKVEQRPLVVQELRATAEKLKLQAEGLLGLPKRDGKEVLETKREILSEKLRKKDSLIEELRKVHRRSYDRFATLVGQEADEIDAEFFMRFADIAESTMDVDERGALLEMGDDVALAWGRADKARTLKVPISTIEIDSVWSRGGLPLSAKAAALKRSVASKFYWNERYERCTYDEERGRFAEWLEEYKRDRAEHEKTRAAHPDPTTLDADFAAAFRDRYSACRQKNLESLPPLTDMLLGGARASEGYFDEHELSTNLGGMVDKFLQWDLGLGREPGVVEFVDALAASGSVTLLSNRVYVGNGGESLWSRVYAAVVTGSSSRGPTMGNPVEDRCFRRASFRLLARMAFVSAELELGEGSTHRFMSLRQAGAVSRRSAAYPSPSYTRWFMSSLWQGGAFWCSTAYPSQVFERYDHFTRIIRRTPENYDAILHVMYLAVFMYRDYPWRPEGQRLPVDVDIAKLLQDNHSGICPHGKDFYIGFTGIDLAGSTLRLAATLPGFYQALLEGDAIWLLLAACGVEGEGKGGSAIFESNFLFGSALQQATRGRGMGRFSKEGLVLNQFFCSREHERELTNMLKSNPELSAWFCSRVWRSALLDVCRQRRRRVLRAVAAGAPSAFAAVVPELLAFARGPGVRGKKERLVEWLESMPRQSEQS